MNTIELPIKSIDIDAFIKMYKAEINKLYDCLDKKKDGLKYINTLRNKVSNEYKNMKNKQKNELKILSSIINERNIIDIIINRENESYINYLKKKGFKISQKDDYKVVKKNIVKKLSKFSYSTYKHNLVKKNGKKYFEKVFTPNRFNIIGQKKILRLSGTGLSNYVEGYKRFNKYSFIPKLVETVIIYKNGVVKNIKYIFEYVDGKPLTTYIKGLNDKKKEQLKEKIKKYINELKKHKDDYTSHELHKDIIITKSGKIYFTGMHFYKYLNTPIGNMLNEAFNWDPSKNNWTENQLIIDSQHIILFELLKKGCIKFRK